MQHIMTDWEQQIDWAKLRKFRVERMVTVMKQKGIRAVLLAKLDTIRYGTLIDEVASMMGYSNAASWAREYREFLADENARKLP